jgi:hypothetical protein
MAKATAALAKSTRLQASRCALPSFSDYTRNEVQQPRDRASSYHEWLDTTCDTCTVISDANPRTVVKYGPAEREDEKMVERGRGRAVLEAPREERGRDKRAYNVAVRR